jgi:hypothetical protein
LFTLFFKLPDLVGVVHNVKAFLLKHVEKGACVTKEYLNICQEGKCLENLTCLAALFL